MNATQEIAELRRSEAMQERGAEELDRLQYAVMKVDPRLVVWGGRLPGGDTAFAPLPVGWRASRGLQITCENRLWLFPYQHKGEIAISRGLAKKIISGEFL